MNLIKSNNTFIIVHVYIYKFFSLLCTTNDLVLNSFLVFCATHKKYIYTSQLNKYIVFSVYIYK